MRFFISCTGLDVWIGHRVLEAIESRGMSGFLFDRDIALSQDFEQRIRAEAEACTHMLALVSPVYDTESEWIRLERELFAGRTTPIFLSMDPRAPPEVFRTLVGAKLNELDTCLRELKYANRERTAE